MINVNGNYQMSSQSPAFRRTVAERMEASRDRIAAKIKAEMDRRGEDPLDLSREIGVRDRTIERWLAKESEPRKRNLKALATHWGLEVSDIQPDLEEEERELAAQLTRIEEGQKAIHEKLDRLTDLAEALTRHAGLTVPVKSEAEEEPLPPPPNPVPPGLQTS